MLIRLPQPDINTLYGTEFRSADHPHTTRHTTHTGLDAISKCCYHYFSEKNSRSCKMVWGVVRGDSIISAFARA